MNGSQLDKREKRNFLFYFSYTIQLRQDTLEVTLLLWKLSDFPQSIHSPGSTLFFISDLTTLSSLVLTAVVRVCETELMRRSWRCLSRLCLSRSTRSSFCSARTSQGILHPPTCNQVTSMPADIILLLFLWSQCIVCCKHNTSTDSLL